jgi:hypothetical protein
VADINNDIAEAEKLLDDPVYLKLKSNKFFCGENVDDK